MANKYEFIKATFDDTLKQITKSSDSWQAFLTSACRNFKLPFEEQVLIYAQRPDATAVLPFDTWNKRFGRRINTGATGIAVLDEREGRAQKLKYYFDISDTRENEFSKPVPIWVYQDAYEGDVITTLEDNFGELAVKYDIIDAATSAAQNIAADNLPDYSRELIRYFKSGSLLEELPDDIIESEFRALVEKSVAYMMLTRLGIAPDEYFEPEDFQNVFDFNTPDAISALGSATSDLAQMGLSEIGKTVLSLQRQNRTFAPTQQSEYTKAEKENERSVTDDTNELHEGRRSEPAKSDSPAGQGDTFWSVRRNAQEVSQGTSQAVLHEPEDAVQTRQPSERDSDESDRDGKPPDATNGEARGIDRDTQSTEYDGMGARDEQSQKPSTGNRDDGSDLSEVSDELPPFLDETLILGIIHNKDDELLQDKAAITEFFKNNSNEERRAEFIKTIYPVKYTELDINNQTVGYYPTDNGLLMWEGEYSTRTKESVFSWDLVAELIESLIKKGTYYKEEQSAQINLFDFSDSIPMEQSFESPEQTSLLFDFTLPQQIIDEALCIGANEQNSKLDIVMVLRRNHDLAYNAAFLKNHYGTNGAGFFFNGEAISVWYDKDGFNVARGKSAQKPSATHLSWEDAAKRITELLELGRYMPQYQIDKVDDRELTFIAERITMFYRDMTESDRERCFPSLIEPLKDKYGYPDQFEIVKSLLSDSDSFEDLNNDYFEFMDNRKKGTIEGHLQYGFHYSPEYVNELMLEMSRPKTDYIAEAGYNPQTEYFISDDEINRLLITKSIVSESKYRIHAFFAENKDLQQRAQMVKNEYGISGYSSGNDNGNFDGKGFYFSHGSIMEPYAKVLLKWTDIAKRIDTLIKADKYITREEWERVPEIEKEHIAATLNHFFSNLPDEYAKPFPADVKPYKLEDSIIRRLGDADALEEIEKMMSDALAMMDKSNESRYNYAKEQYADFLSFKNGEYHPYPVPTKYKYVYDKVPDATENETALSDERIDELNTLNDLFHACKMDDIIVEYDGDTLLAYDDENTWKNAEVYQFILDEVLSFDIYGNLMEGNYVDEKIIVSIKDYTKNYGVEPQILKTGADIRRQLELKKANPDAIILYKQHKAYVVIGDDARMVASEIQLKLQEITYPDGKQQFVPETWFEEERLEDVANTLTENGHRVIIADAETAQDYLTKTSELIPDSIKNYVRLGAQYPDMILFYRVGDFYEVMGENAKVAAKELDLVLTGRTVNNQTGERTPMVGVPAHTLDSYISQLVAKGYKIAVANAEEIQRTVIPFENEEKQETLSQRLVNFIKDYDFYDYQDNLEIGETDEDMEAKIEKDLQNREFCETLISFLTDREAELRIDEHESDGAESERSETLHRLIEDVAIHLKELPQEKTVETPDYSNMIGDEIVIDGSHFIIEEVNGNYVSMRDMTFAEDTGFPIFRREHIESIFPLHKEQVQEPVETIPAPKKPVSKVATFDLHPEISQESRHQFNFAEKELETVGKKERFRRNIAAINIIKECEFDNRFATPEEQEILAQYVGWGGLPEAFDENNSAWADEYKELIVTLSPDEYDAAKESTLTAFYTPQSVISAIYSSLQSMGFKQGNILEPSCGIGNFIGMLPKEMQDSKMYGVEIDSISAQIAQQLYQKSSVLTSPFEKAVLPDSFFDVVVGNVPFGDFKVADKRYDKHNFLIHDYFFAKSIDKVRAGGLLFLVTSKGTMDKENSAVRRYIAQRAELLGAIRLPNDTFKGNAGTDVTSDILILKKRDRIVNEEPDWLMIDSTEDGIRMNKYFVNHPEMIMGRMVMKSGRFGPESTCEPFDDRTLEEQLEQAFSNIQTTYEEVSIEDDLEEDVSYIPADPTVKNFSFTLVDGTIYFRENSIMKEVKTSATGENRIKGLLQIRESVRKLIELQTDDFPESEIQAEQKHLNEIYDAFTKKYGLISSRANRMVFSDDNSYYLLSALEVLDEEGNLERKADMFTKRTIKPHIPVTSVDTSMEAFAVSMGEKAKPDMEYMMELTGKSEEEIYSDLVGVIFLNPMYSEERPSESKYLPADEYLSGNVRAKLRTAENLAKVKPEFQVNVEALQKVQPQDLSASEIDVRLGATWLPPDVVQKFIYEFLDTPYYSRYKIKVNFSPHTGEWNITGKSSDYGNVKANSTYGTTRINAYKIIEQTLNLKDVRIFDYVEDADGKRTAVLNKKETAIAQSKQELIKQAFKDWIWSDPDRRTKLCRLYNDKFNSTRPREYDGSHIIFSGMNPEISLRPHQKNAVAHILYGGNTLLAHAVGAGKTFEMVATAQESKRLGLCTKSLFVVPNHLTEQWAAEYLTLYPSANILVATKKDFETKNRKTFCGRIATGDYDAVIIGHSQFEKIPMSLERQRYLIELQIDEIVEGIEDAKRNHAENFTVKQMMKTKKSLETRLAKLNDQSRKDDIVTFEELGVDRIFIDESHYYKNLFLYTKMRNVGGIAQTEAQKSSDLFMKCRYLDEITGGKGTVFATGTPISNSMVELYTIQRYLQYHTLQMNGLQLFDAWASTFGETVTAVELTPEGSGYRAKTRFARFYNLPELMAMFKEIADIQTADMLDLPVPKANYHNIAVKPSDLQTEMVERLSERADKVRNRQVDSNVDNMLVITNDGRKLALDQRMVDPLLPDFEGSKVNACVDNIYQIWETNADKKSAQLVFCDLSTPKPGTFSVYFDIRDKLIEKGIPESEIAFIHDAKTETQKADLFKKVRSGEVRVLMGSTQKMGAGTNVQDRLIALHDLDCPWRPSDLEQRSGRIIRQGNSNEEVEIFRYVTEQTFDAYLYQLVEGKQKFASQIMSSKSPVRSAEDIDETALSYAEIKMLATGNPYIKEKMDLDIQVQKLRLLKSNFLSERYSLEDKVLSYFPKKLAEYDERIAGMEKDIITAKEHPKANGDSFIGMIVNGIPYSERADAGATIIDVCKTLPDTQTYPLGEYRGFKLEVNYDSFEHQHRVIVKGSLSYEGTLGTDGVGNVMRIDNIIDGLEGALTTTKQQRENTQVQFETAKEEIKKPFAKEEELKQKEARLNELNALLNVDKKENDLVDDAPDEGDASPSKKPIDRDAR